MTTIPRSYVRALTRIRCSIFQTTFNPSSQRTGAKYLRAPLRGPAMVQYYPKPEAFSVTKLNKIYPGWNLVDIDEVVRLNDVESKKKRGKGAPKKAKTPAESRRARKKR
ncbi:hypothetical protein BD410DRAFT_793197 [Rickenella mellea]|uniref:Small ribosomal subunit protein mS33 n=1 Tax=Rickenella mellea TaxID=50990 RepID=A0A4Y7PSW1_9AGAM|nr:hypothetical protein BD410DRAFT_793197 [Rickenella mellea]